MRLTLLALALLSLPLAAADPKPKDKGKPNRLAKESSPYLQQHGHNPVDWFPWGQEAFDRAKKEKKLIFLSIGYSSCHWCHVMERESFANEAVAKTLNDNFVCIKVDREERPDVDEIYMTSLQVVGQSGGWPLTMFLTPDGKPIFGGTYFPPDDKPVEGGTITGLKSILKRVIDLNTEKGGELIAQANRIAEMTTETMEKNSRAVPLIPLDRELVKDAVRWFEIDPVHGGIGNKLQAFKHTKFPRAAALLFLQQQARKPGSEKLAAGVTLTLQKMAEGGIYDHLGGGFHRYSTERTWTVPHFEKMLYDNAQLVELYAEAYRQTPDPLYKRVVAESLSFIAREMTSPEGAFYSALDADSNGREGEFYVWTDEELQKALGNDADVTFVKAVYDAAATNFEEKYHILRLPKPTAELAKDLKMTEADLLAKLEPLKAKLLEHRSHRERPFLDTKVITAWNGQMIAGYARAGEVFQSKEFTAAAAKAADFLLTKMRGKDDRLFRLYAAVPNEKPTPRGTAFLDDYAFLLHGLLTLHDATGDPRWLDESKAVADTMMKWHGDADHGGFYFTAHDNEKLFARSKDSYDGAQPSGNGVAARDLLRLWAKTKDAKYRDASVRTVRLFAGTMKTSPGSVPSLSRGLDELLDIAEKDPTALGPKDAPPAAPAKAPREARDVVKAELKAGEVADGSQPFTVTLTIAAPWHVYANPVENDSLKESVTTVEVYVGDKKVEAAIEFPKGTAVKDAVTGDYKVYDGTVTITGKLPRKKDDGVLEVRVRVLACKERLCLLPSVMKLK
ncbi:DUF255 domain-containing protein [Limnoglobus roseus]|uniref:Thioredoxin domain-containing protein n=1 Tax=Limnoglobus roseus TaxID=2598579 RepID=A0A5C1ARQ0_9BACT|nr:DUF255 domain-containing protein [Limnoglobus roseus]QEL20382.1 hypothetical protein PX52LOC_07475 [Limnoglobus roseus]